MKHDREPTDHLDLLLRTQVRPEIGQPDTRARLVWFSARGGTSVRAIEDLRCLTIPDARKTLAAAVGPLAGAKHRR